MLLASGCFLCGCPNPNLYTTPRTLNPGDVQLQVAAEGIGATFDTTTTTQNADGTTTTHPSTASFLVPMIPTVGVRVGIADGFELGARVANFDTLAGDAKIRLLKGTVDLALDPGLQFIYIAGISSSDSQGNSETVGAGIFYFHVPVLIGFNVSPTVSLIASPGLVFSVATASVDTSDNTQEAALSSGVWGRLGFGVNIRTSKKVSIQPEITFMKDFQNDNILLYIFGLGFNVGAQPDYSDIGWGGGSAPSSPPPPPPPPGPPPPPPPNPQ
jgi:hypothetical protein